MGSTPRAGPDPPAATLLDERELVDALRRGDEAAFERLVREHGPRMTKVARRLLSTDDDSRDAVQEAFLSAFRSIDRFQSESRLSTWLHRITVNAALMKLRSRKRHPEQSIEVFLPRFQSDGHHEVEPAPWRANDPGSSDAAERDELRALVRESIDRLPFTHRSVLVLRDIEGLDTVETAERLGVTPNAVKIRLHRARIALRGLLDPHLRESPSPS